jgi:hypothetical protein
MTLEEALFRAANPETATRSDLCIAASTLASAHAELRRLAVAVSNNATGGEHEAYFTALTALRSFLTSGTTKETPDGSA